MEWNKNHVSFEMDIFTRNFLRVTRRVQLQSRHSLTHSTQSFRSAIFHPQHSCHLQFVKTVAVERMCFLGLGTGFAIFCTQLRFPTFFKLSFWLQQQQQNIINNTKQQQQQQQR